MKMITLLMLLMVLPARIVSACPVCKMQQPKITQGLTHGAGPQSNWDLIIIAIVTAITLWAFILSLKYLIMPGEKNKDHIKQSILSNLVT